MFSSRLAWNLTPNPLTQLLEAKRAQGIRMLDLTESNPTRAGFSYEEAAILGAIASPLSLNYEPSPRGLLSAREAIATYYASKFVIPSPAGARNLSASPRDSSSRSALLGMTGQCTPDSLFLTASTSEAYSYLFKLLGNPGDEILVPQPSYPLFEYLAGLEALATVHYPLSYHEGWRINFEVLRELITPKTKALVIVNPNNPTGSYLQQDELARLNALCRERQLALIVDEVFADYAQGDDENRVATVVGNEGALTFTLSGLSKVVGLPQMKLGWIQVSGKKMLVEAAAARLELIADTFLSVSTPIQHAVAKLLAQRGEIQKQIQDRVQQNESRLKNLPVLKREGGWYAMIEVERHDEELAQELLERANVFVHPGYFYDVRGRQVLVVSLLTRPEVFEEGIAKLHALLA